MSNDVKFYVVWKWKETWIFNSWESCKNSINWFSNAKYKSFSNKESAKIALKEWWEKYYNIKKSTKKEKVIDEDIPFFKKCIAVDAACSGNPGEMEYRWIDLQTWNEIFHEKFKVWTNNIGEFLAIVHGLRYIWNDNRVIYSDSRIAISRVNQWKCKTQIKVDNPDFWKTLDAIQWAEKWSNKNWIKHKILKRNTEDWWEIPADFGRK